MTVQVAIENDCYLRRILFRFAVDEFAFREWKENRYGNASPLVSLNAIDPVGEALHLLREFYLDQAGSPRSVEKVEVELVDPPARSLPPALSTAPKLKP